MKKFVVFFFVATILLAALPTDSASAATLPRCSISTWEVIYNGARVSGGCTCHVAERVLAKTGKYVPNWHNAGSWWANSTWPKNANEPRAGAIAAFSYGHVAYVESMSLKSSTAPVTVKTVQYTKNWIKYSATLYKVTDTYTVKLSHKDYSRILNGDNSVRYTSFDSKLTRYYWKITNLYRLDSVSSRPMPATPANVWATARTGGASSLQGFIYP